MTTYKPLVQAVAAESGELLTALRFARQAVSDYGGYPSYEFKQQRLEDVSRAERAVRACRDAVQRPQGGPKR